MSLGQELTDALVICDQMRAAGTPEAQIHASLETHLRATWVCTREWKYLCETCRDTGAEVLVCPNQPCDRRKEHGSHDYIRPCFCRAGERLRGRPRTEDDAISAAARTAKPKPFSKVGR